VAAKARVRALRMSSFFNLLGPALLLSDAEPYGGVGASPLTLERRDGVKDDALFVLAVQVTATEGGVLQLGRQISLGPRNSNG
jgi:hypothetical protein